MLRSPLLLLLLALQLLLPLQLPFSQQVQDLSSTLHGA
jgi:hypothetical protein